MNEMTAIDILCKGTMQAAAEILRYRNGRRPATDQDYKNLTQDLRNAIKGNIDSVMQEWKEALEANMGEAWLKTILNTQCNDLALQALRAGKWIS